MKRDLTNHRLGPDNWYLAESIGCLTRPSYLGMLAAVVLVHVLYYVLWAYYLTFFAWLAKEDGVLEYASAVLLFVAGCIFLRGAFVTQSRIQKGWAVVFATALIFMTGEEISWGQRIFGFHWEALEAINNQNETNLHNLPFINMPRLLSVGSLLCGLVMPVALLLSSYARYLAFDRLRFPLPHPIASLCFLLSYAWGKGFHAAPYDSPSALSVEESSEFSIGLACFLYASVWLLSRKTERQFRVDTESQ